MSYHKYGYVMKCNNQTNCQSGNKDDKHHKPRCNDCLNRDFHDRSAYLKCELGELNECGCCPKLPCKNCEEYKYMCYNYNGLYTKSLAHNLTDGRLVDKTQYEKMVDSLLHNNQQCLNTVQLDTNAQVKLANPLASLSTPLIGKPQCLLKIDEPPKLSSDAGAADMVEVYSLAVCRDVPFVNYSTDSTIATILDNNHMNKSDILSSLRYYTPANTNFTAQTLFRGISANEKYGPYISQLLLLNVQLGGINYPQKYATPDSRTVAQGVPTRVEWGVNEAETINIQNTNLSALPAATLSANISPRYIFSGRSLAEAVHTDPAYQLFFQAATILSSLGASPNPGFPVYANQSSFITGSAGPNIQCSLADVAGLALKHAWYWKWQVFRRLRPEAFGLAINNVQNSIVPNANNYDLSNVVLNNGVLTDIASVNNSWGSASSYTLPLAYREGSPTHPSYPAGHAVIAGACCTILKIFFDADKLWSSLPGLQIGSQNRNILPTPLTGPVIEADVTGANLQDYAGNDANNLTICGEINKLASNVAIGRNWSGVHYRSDGVQGMKLGEQVAISYMEDILASSVENNLNGCPPKITFKKFDDTYCTIYPKTCKEF